MYRFQLETLQESMEVVTTGLKNGVTKETLNLATVKIHTAEVQATTTKVQTHSYFRELDEDGPLSSVCFLILLFS
jgi:hypothetical protein